ncbi:hypothetical protein HCN44_008036 [Aphidius gifuensis]|uniref:Uncharacterized protein n=1 Tax=Aphidius gifuensis TaxID=684658 RepID=A0A834XPP5_APHGI|nr:hypothetical protein HCN44_008036 [Aphidius gifuensis]
MKDDEDDDDDDVKPVEPLVQAASPVQTLPVSVQSDLNTAAAAVASENFGNQADAVASGEAGSVEDEDKPQEQSLPVGSPVDNSLSHATVLQPIQQVAAIPAQATSSDDDDDDDDDDDEEDLDIDITGDEDSDEDDDDDDEDDDGDDLSDLAGARAARGMESPETNDVSVSAIYVAKYNRFVDNILSRINNILEKKYNPVMVRLSSPASKSNKSKTNKKSKKNKTKLLSRNDANTNESTTLSTTENQKIETNLTESFDNTLSSRKSSTKPVRKSNKKKNKNKTKTSLSTTSSPLTTTLKTTTKKPKLSSTLSPIKKKQNNNNKTKKLKSRARATLYGLPTLKRSGDVSVNMMSNHTTIRTKFSLGPLILKVEKEFGRSNKKELRSATATTAEMSGKLSLRVMNGGAATLHSIRVLQPKQVRIDSKDDHDRTREFVWRRSSHIAHVVSQKLSSATRSMLRPPPLITTTSTTATTTSPIPISTSPPSTASIV